MKPPLIRQLALKNFLSFGPEGVTLDLQPLNVLIGPNASGKSNLVEALAVLRGAARDLAEIIRSGGGIGEYLWKSEIPSPASIDALLTEGSSSATELRYHLELARSGAALAVVAESVEAEPLDPVNEMASRPVYRMKGGRATIHPRSGHARDLAPDSLKGDQSVLSQRRDPDLYPDIAYLASAFERIALFQEWTFGRRSPVRLPQPTDLPSDFLLPDASNLNLVLHELLQTSSGREELTDLLRLLYEHARFLTARIHGGPLQLYIEEVGGQQIPAPRLSDGTLRYLCLLAILCHPSPPPVVAIEEPELGLHPDILPTIARLLKKASERTQLFVTTHSDALVSALSDVPQSVLVVERMPSGTVIERLEPDRLGEWLEEYRLGEIWRMGEIGGNRW